MSTRLSRYLTIEELNIEKVIRQEKDDDTVDEFDVLASNIKAKKEIEELKNETNEEDTGEDTGDEGGDEEDTGDEDSGKDKGKKYRDDDSKETKKSSKSDTEETDEFLEMGKDDKSIKDNDKEAEKATESFYLTIRNNSMNFISTEQEYINNIATKLNISYESDNFFYKHLVYNNATGQDGLLLRLRDMGIDYGKIALVHVAKGILYTLTRIYDSLIKASKHFFRYVLKRSKNYKKYKLRISKAKQILNLINNTKIDTTNKFEDRVTIATLKSGTDLDFNKHIKNLVTLNELYNDNLVLHTKRCIYGIRQVIELVMREDYDIPVMKYIDKIDLPSFKKLAEQDYTFSYVYSKNLPGDRYFGLDLPKYNLDEYGEIKNSYQQSRSYVNIDDKLISQGVDACDYMNISYMNSFLDALDKLCDKGLELEKQFYAIEKLRARLSPNLKDYIYFLTSKKDKITVRESLAEFIGLKTHFLDLVLISGSIHIHDVNASVLSSGLHFVKSSLELYADV